MKSYNIVKDIKAIREIFKLTQESFSSLIGVSRSNIIRYEKGEIFPHKSVLEKIYSYPFENNLKINKAKEMLYLDQKGDNILLIHGAKEEIKGDIKFDHLNGTKDFGAGFYLAETLDSAASWVAERKNGSCYCFYYKNNNLKILRFSVSKEWMYAILYFRGQLEDYILSKEILDIVSQINEADIIIAPIADNNMYETLNSFAYSQISDVQCLHALSANNLGLQYVFKSQKSIDSLSFIDRLYLCESEKRQYLDKKIELAKDGRSKAELAISYYRREGKYIDELLTKKNG